MNTNGDVTPRTHHSWRSAFGDLERPLTGLHSFPRDDLDQFTVSAAPSLRWVAGALGAGLAQAATAVSARRDVGPVELSLAASAAAVGVHLYGQGVKQLLLDALMLPDGDRLLSAGLAIGGLAGCIIGTGLASTSWPPGQVAGVALLAGSTAAVHHSLGQAFVMGEEALDQDVALARDEHPHKMEATWAVMSLAVLAGMGAGYGVWASPRMGPAEGAGLGLLCHALLGTAWSTHGVICRWREGQRTGRGGR